MTTLPVTLADVQAAARAIAGAIVRTPIRHSRTLSGIAGCEVWLKFENRQFTASFKERGALNFLLSLDEESRARADPGACGGARAFIAVGVK
jgi:threonine dehydratase